MENWQKILEITTAEVDNFLQEIGTAVECFVEEVSSTMVTLGEQLQELVVSEIDQNIQDFLELFIDENIEAERIFGDDLEDLPEELDFISVSLEKPTPDRHPACIGCQHYHGRVYGKNLLVCGMHPYGWHDENCPDWEKKSNCH
jgi:hypothetical protein